MKLRCKLGWHKWKKHTQGTSTFRVCGLCDRVEHKTKLGWSTTRPRKGDQMKKFMLSLTKFIINMLVFYMLISIIFTGTYLTFEGATWSKGEIAIALLVIATALVNASIRKLSD